MLHLMISNAKDDLGRRAVAVVAVDRLLKKIDHGYASLSLTSLNEGNPNILRLHRPEGGALLATVTTAR